MDTTSSAATPDRIEKQVELSASRERVWQALTDYLQFGEWFRIKLDGPFVDGQSVSGQITHPGYEHLRVEFVVAALQPQDYFAYRWHPYAIDASHDYSAEPMTLVEFRLSDTAGGGTLLSVVESGFENVPAERRAEAFRMNSGGWAAQMGNIQRYVDGE